MADAVIFAENETPQKLLSNVTSIAKDDPVYVSRTDVLIFTATDKELYRTLLKTVPFKYLKHDNGSIVEMTQSEKDTLDTELEASRLINARARTKAFIDTTNGKIVKALALAIMDELNILRALHGLPDRTANQLLNAVNQKVDNGDTD